MTTAASLAVVVAVLCTGAAAAHTVGNPPTRLLDAIAEVESRSNPRAIAFHDGGVDNHAVGKYQMLITTAEWMGMSREHSCRDTFRFVKVSGRVASACPLFGERVAHNLADKYVRRLWSRYGGNLTDVISAYNMGTARRGTDGTYLNQGYVDRVLRELGRLDSVGGK